MQNGEVQIDVWRPRSTPLEAFSTTFKSIVGSGICALPYAMKCAGWFNGAVGLLVVALITSYTMRQIILCVQLTRALLKSNKSLQSKNEPQSIGFRGMGEFTYGRMGALVVDIVLLFAQIGGNCAFVAFVVSNLVSVLSPLGDFFNTTTITLGILPILVLLSLPRSTTFLAPTSMIGNFALATGVGTVLVYCFKVWYANGMRLEWLFLDVSVSQGWSGFCMFFGLAAFALCAHAEVVSVENDTLDKKAYVQYILLSAMGSITILYLTFAVFSYLCFKVETNSIIFLNLPAGAFVSIVKFSMAIVVLFSYPISLFPASQTLDELLLVPLVTNEDTPLLPTSETGEERDMLTILASGRYYWLGNLIRIVIVLITGVVALYLSDFGFLASLVGAIAGGLLSFIFPGVFYGKLLSMQGKLTRTDLVLVILQVGFGFALMGAGIVVAILPPS